MKAVITANDESGNIFKKIYLQDETGAIEMEVDQNSVYNYYPVADGLYRPERIEPFHVWR